MVLTCDKAGNIFTSGYFRGNPDFDPSGTGTHTLNAETGTLYVARYNTIGDYLWAFNLGEGNVDNAPFGMKNDLAGNVYLTGFFQGSSQDFDPSSTGTAYLTSRGGFDVFVAKYNSRGEYQWAFGIGGQNTDVGRDIEIDESGNVYVAGDFEGSNIDFNPSQTEAANLTSNNRDVFIAKYNSNGQYQWAKNFGGSGSDISWSVAYTNNNIYITGSFQGLMNFSPGPISDNLVSKGANDFYMTKFDENGKPGFQEIDGSEFEIPCEFVLLAIGFVHTAPEGIVKELGISVDGRGNINATEENYQTNIPNVFTAGDARRGQSLVVWAISEGREAARAVDTYLMGHSVLESKDDSYLNMANVV